MKTESVKVISTQSWMCLLYADEVKVGIFSQMQSALKYLLESHVVCTNEGNYPMELVSSKNIPMGFL